ncbi:MAG: D-glycero-beta-D-manno-heptose-7-phosphate kinase, partial [Candidatus Binatia bacterium]
SMNNLLALVEKFPRAHLLVVGDLMLDRFIRGEVERISPEAPVPVLQVVSEHASLGGAANVIHNVQSLGGRVTACGIVGKDNAGKRIVTALRDVGASTAGVFVDGGYHTIQKTRVIAASPRHQQIVRLDRESRQPAAPRTLMKLRDFIAQRIERFDGVIISDYGKGVIHPELLDAVADRVTKHKLVCVVDPKKENFDAYRFPTLITPNQSEAGEASGIAINDEASLVAAGTKLVRKWQAKAVLITRGPEGMSLFRPRLGASHFPTAPRDVFEVTGAGDTVVAVCALALACGAGYEEAAVLANLAAGFVGDEVGTVAVPREKLKRGIKDKT